MAEGFARAYGSDVIEPVSAGLAPASIIQPLTKQVRDAKNINIDDLHAKDLSEVELDRLDLIVNISGRPFPAGVPIEIRNWKVEDPIGQDEETYIAVRDQIERLVMGLILDLRRGTQPSKRSPSLRTILNRGTRATR